MGWDIAKDYMNAFLGALALLLSLILIPDIKRSAKYWIPTVGMIIFLAWLGIDKINRDNATQIIHETDMTLIKGKLTTISYNLEKIGIHINDTTLEPKIVYPSKANIFMGPGAQMNGTMSNCHFNMESDNHPDKK